MGNDVTSEYSEQQEELLELLLAEECRDFSPYVDVIRPANKNDYLAGLPLSYAQQRLWFLDQLESESATYNIPGALRLVGHLDIDAFERSINEIIRRHEVLRTTFSMTEGHAVQVIAPELELALSTLDLSQLPEEQSEAEVRRLAMNESGRPFDLSVGPLLRVSLLDLGEDAESGVPAHVVLFTLHHIVSDGWSTDIFVREFMALYEAFSRGQPSPLPELPIQYVDYAVWQREWLQGEVLGRQLSYWKRQLAGASEVLTLPTDRPRPVVQSYRGASYGFTLSSVFTEQLHALSRHEGVTLFMTLLAAFQLLLSRYSGQRDIWVGSPIGNRNRVEIEGLIGFFVNTLVLRTDLSGNPGFSELLRRVREVCLGAQAHQDLPFEKLVEELAPVRDMSHSPLFQVMLVLQNAPARELELPGLRIYGVEAETETAKFDLQLELFEALDGLQAALGYASDLFDKSTIERLANRFQVLLEAIIARPESRLSELPLLTEPERHQLLIEWNDTQVEYPQDRCIHELFEVQVERGPEATAVVYENQCLSYRELNAKANQLAHHLRALGVGLDTLVGICVERSLEMVIGLLGILKAGGAYVPLDPTYPKERLLYILEDARPSVLLTQARLRDVLPAHPNIFCLDAD